MDRGGANEWHRDFNKDGNELPHYPDEHPRDRYEGIRGSFERRPRETKSALEAEPVPWPRPPRPFGDLLGDTSVFRERAREFVKSTVENLVWFAADVVASHFAPFAGPILLKSLYLSRQIVTAVDGMAGTEGFNLKIGVPGFSVIDGEHGGVLPPGFQLVVLVRLGDRLERREGGDIIPEIQVFRPWFPDVDVSGVAVPREAGLGAVPAVVADDGSSDPWAEWMALLGPHLIDDLPTAVTRAPTMAYVMKVGS